jgi:hypothetical protein
VLGQEDQVGKVVIERMGDGKDLIFFFLERKFREKREERDKES